MRTIMAQKGTQKSCIGNDWECISPVFTSFLRKLIILVNLPSFRPIVLYILPYVHSVWSWESALCDHIKWFRVDQRQMSLLKLTIQFRHQQAHCKMHSAPKIHFFLPLMIPGFDSDDNLNIGFAGGWLVQCLVLILRPKVWAMNKMLTHFCKSPSHPPFRAQ